MPNLIKCIRFVLGFFHCFHMPICNLVLTNSSNNVGQQWLSGLPCGVPSVRGLAAPPYMMPPVR